MDVFRTIASQIDAIKLPLFAVTLTAVPRRQTPVLLMLHWHGFLCDESRHPLGTTSVPSSGLQLNVDWCDLHDLDQHMLDAAWQLGAWDLVREQRRGCSTVGAPERETLECRQAFGDDPLGEVGTSHLVAEAPDREDMMHLAARVGYVHWEFRPVRSGLWRDVARDDTLAADGSRQPPCPVQSQIPPGRQAPRQTRYRLGQIRHLLLP